MPQNRFGVLGHDLRARHDAVDGHGADHQGHDGVRRDAERQERDEGGLRAGVVGALRPRHALDRALAEAARILRELLLDRVGREGPEHRAVAGQDAQDAADGRAAQDRPGRSLQVLQARQQPADRLPDDVAHLGVVEVAQDLGDAEEAHGQRRRSRCRRTGTAPRRSCAPGRSRGRCRPSRAGCRAGSWRWPCRIEPRASTTAKTRPITISEKYSAGPKISASLVSGAPSAAMNTVATQPAKKEPIAAMPSATPARPCRAIW